VRLKNRLDSEVFQSRSAIILDSTEADSKSGQNILLQPSELNSFSEISILGAPILSNSHDAIGVLTIKLEGASHKLNDIDAAFIKKASEYLFDVINEIDNRNKLLNVLISACNYERIHAETDIVAFLVSKQKKGTPFFHFVKEDLSETETSQVSSFMLRNPAILTKLESEDDSFEQLKCCYDDQKNINTENFSYIPINDSNNEIIGILRLQYEETKSKKVVIDEGILLSKYLGQVLSRISEETITFKSFINRELGIFS
jgi:hypothetical protein